MSLFIGPIHHWLFNKIKIAESIEKKTLILGYQEGILSASDLAEAKEKFADPTPDTPLESQIDHDSIHAWLQERIAQVESRQAFFVTRITEADPKSKHKLLDLYRQNASQTAQQIDKIPATPEEIVQSIHTFLLEGMPCDRAQRMVESKDEKVAWIYDPCLHKPYWDAVNGDVAHYYDFREAWIHSFVREIQPSWTYTLNHKGIHQIEKEAS